MMLRVSCVELCGGWVDAPLPIERDSFARLLARRGWFLSVLTPPGQPVAFGALCPRCARRVYSPELLRTAKEARDKMAAAPLDDTKETS